MTARRDFDGSTTRVAEHFDDLAEGYHRSAFSRPGHVELSRRDLLAIGRAAELAGPPGAACDVGVGTGRIARALQGRGFTVTGVDASAGMREQAARRLEGVELVAGALPGPLPLPDGAFGLVTCLRVLKYVEDLPAALSELARLCEPGGVVCFDVANRRSVARFGYPARMVWPVTHREALAAAGAAGLQVVEVLDGTRLPEPVWRAAPEPVVGWLSRLDRLATTAGGRAGARSWTFLAIRGRAGGGSEPGAAARG